MARETKSMSDLGKLEVRKRSAEEAFSRRMGFGELLLEKAAGFELLVRHLNTRCNYILLSGALATVVTSVSLLQFRSRAI